MATTDSYDLDMSRAATEAGQPIERMAGPGVTVPKGETWLCVFSHGRILARHCDTHEPEVMRIDSLAERLGFLDDYDSRRDPVSFVFPDMSSLSHVESALVHQESAEARGQASMLRAAHTMTNSRIVILTEALRRKFYAQEGINRGSLSEWVRAFGLDTSWRTSELMEALFSMSTQGQVSTDKELSSLYFHEMNALARSRFSSPKSASSAYRSMNVVSDIIAFQDALDPLLLDRNVLDGSVSPVLVTDFDSGGVIFETIPPFGLKEGAKASIFPGDEDPRTRTQFTGTVEETYVVDDRLMARVSLPKRRRRADPPIRLEPGDILHLTPDLYVPHGKGPSGRWLTRESCDWSDHGKIPDNLGEMMTR